MCNHILMQRQLEWLLHVPKGLTLNDNFGLAWSSRVAGSCCCTLGLNCVEHPLVTTTCLSCDIKGKSVMNVSIPGLLIRASLKCFAWHQTWLCHSVISIEEWASRWSVPRFGLPALILLVTIKCASNDEDSAWQCCLHLPLASTLPSPCLHLRQLSMFFHSLAVDNEFELVLP